ncbi:methyltransferase, TIGR04325 family [Pseudomonadota bacterium]
MALQIWEGIFNCFEEIEEAQDIFSSTLYQKNIRKKIERLQAQTTSDAEYPLYGLIRILMTNKKKVKVLDFGGGAGESFYSMPDTVRNNNALDFHVYDNKEMCLLGETLKNDNSNLKFFNIKPTSKYDIIHLGSSLQYVEHWGSLLCDLISMSSEFILISDAFTGEIPSFVTAQDYYGMKTPFWFLNLKEVNSVFTENGYDLVMKLPYIPLVRGNREFYDMTNFPAKNRIPFSLHLLYTRTH